MASNSVNDNIWNCIRLFNVSGSLYVDAKLIFQSVLARKDYLCL